MIGAFKNFCCDIVNKDSTPYTGNDIAYTLGCSHPSNFRKAFKRHFQFTPAELRKFNPK
jgi:AraC-like DNA-binding protein